jgi:hypothetical protein
MVLYFPFSYLLSLKVKKKMGESIGDYLPPLHTKIILFPVLGYFTPNSWASLPSLNT